MTTERIIKKLESCKTTKSAVSFLNKNGIETTEGFGKSYDFYINDNHYRIVKTSLDNSVRIIKYSTRTITVEQQLKAIYMTPTCFGKTL